MLRRERETVIEQQRKDREKERENAAFSRYNQTVKERESEEGEAEGEVDHEGEEEAAGNDTYEKYESYGGEAQTSNMRDRNRESEFDDDSLSPSQESRQREQEQEQEQKEVEVEDAVKVEWASSMISKVAVDEEEEDGQCEGEGEAEVEGDSVRSGRNQTKSAHALDQDSLDTNTADKAKEIAEGEDAVREPESSSSRCKETEHAILSQDSGQEYPIGLMDSLDRESDHEISASPLEHCDAYDGVVDCQIDGCDNDQSGAGMLSRDICITASKS